MKFFFVSKQLRINCPLENTSNFFQFHLWLRKQLVEITKKSDLLTRTIILLLCFKQTDFRRQRLRYSFVFNFVLGFVNSKFENARTTLV